MQIYNNCSESNFWKRLKDGKILTNIQNPGSHFVLIVRNVLVWWIACPMNIWITPLIQMWNNSFQKTILEINNNDFEQHFHVSYTINGQLRQIWIWGDDESTDQTAENYAWNSSVTWRLCTTCSFFKKVNNFAAKTTSIKANRARTVIYLIERIRAANQNDSELQGT